ncbi:MAG TPA: hypothetical protein VML75_11480 [Kofleriaceae bacterium]|nr:hypothetical protein [Kofleriaceae bacterium]
MDAGGDDAAGCTDGVCLAPPANGFQVLSQGTTISAGEDVEYCEVVQLPGTAADTYYVSKFESKMTSGSHHLIVAAVESGSATESGLEVGQRVTCGGPGGVGEDLIEVTGSQTIYDVEEFPEGVGRVYRGGQYLVFNYHYLNTTDDELPARAAVNFHLTDAANVQHIAMDFGFYNLSISTPPGESRSFTKTCYFTEEVVVHKLVRHTHRWGTDFTAWYAGGAKDGQQIFTTPTYEDNDHIFPEPITVAAGEGFTFECNYFNDTDSDLVFGTKATDEMCILFGTYWSASGNEIAEQGCFF